MNQGVTHAAKGNIIKIAMVGHQADDAPARTVNTPLRITKEFNIIILQPKLALAQCSTVCMIITGWAARLAFATQQRSNPLAPILGDARVGRIS